MIKEFNINFTEKEISYIYQKVKDYPWDLSKSRRMGSWNK